MFRIVPLELETHFAEGTVNAFLAIGDSVTLIDTGNTGKASLQQLKSKLHRHSLHLRILIRLSLPTSISTMQDLFHTFRKK